MASRTLERCWYDEPGNIGALIRHLDAQGETTGWTASDFARVCEEPWHYETEWQQLLASQRDKQTQARIEAARGFMSPAPVMSEEPGAATGRHGHALGDSHAVSGSSETTTPTRGAPWL